MVRQLLKLSFNDASSGALKNNNDISHEVEFSRRSSYDSCESYPNQKISGTHLLALINCTNEQLVVSGKNFLKPPCAKASR